MIEAILHDVCKKRRPEIEALEAALCSEEGLVYRSLPPVTEEQKQRLLFGHLFAGLDQPLKIPPCSSIG
ncbi:hypothetical protein [Methylomonas koyamae]|uniref:hypothetical protein n=1 Tax=Methylomonas koyamae TaxID=702114 RepID=UPI0007C8A47C|nr:hypothetical protein [Methylomonas koyamae]ATG90519.1 hypothetical protein MKLM6_2296 [Methylomonas koyamae]